MPCNFTHCSNPSIIHARTRYSKKVMSKKLKKAGLKIDKLSYFNTFLFPIVYLARKFHNMIKSKPSLDLKKNNVVTNTALYSLLKIESKLLKFMDFPFGVSVIAIAKKE